MSAPEDDALAALAEEPDGPPVFDLVYFLDREKSNQALAGSSLELSILAGNAIEALLAAGGAELMDQNMGSEGGTSTNVPICCPGRGH